MWTWALLLAAIVFVMYMWIPRTKTVTGPGCNTCGGGKNVPVE